jgi:AIG2-like family
LLNGTAERPTKLNGAAVALGRAQTVNEFVIAFDIWSDRNNCAAANLIPAHGTRLHAWGVLYQTSEEGRARLRKVEGWRYEETCISVRTHAGQEAEATTFFGKYLERQGRLWTSAEYLGYIIKGLREHEVQEEYVQRILDVAIRTNERAEDANGYLGLKLGEAKFVLSLSELNGVVPSTIFGIFGLAVLARHFKASKGVLRIHRHDGRRANEVRHARCGHRPQFFH